MIPFKIVELKGFYGTDYKKEPFLLLSKQKREGGHHISGQFILKAKKKKNGINLKRISHMVSTVYFFLCQLLQNFFKNGFAKTGRTLRRKLYYFNA